MKAWPNPAAPTQTSLTNPNRIWQLKEFFFVATEAGMLLKTMRATREPPNKSMKTKELHNYRITV